MSPTEREPRRKSGLVRRTLRNWWLPILAVWVALSALGGAYSYMRFRPTYRAFSLLRVDSLEPDLYGVRGGEEDQDAFLGTQLQLIASPNVLGAAGTNPRAVALPRIQSAKDVVLELKKVIEVGVVPRTSLIEVAMSSESPYEAATLVNAVAEAFIASNRDWSKGMTENRAKSLEDYMAMLRMRSTDVDRRWRELAARAGGGVFLKGTKERSELTPQQYEWLRRDLFETNLELAIAQEWLATLKAEASDAPKDPASPADEAILAQEVERRFKRDPQAAALASELIEAKTRLEETKRGGKPAADPAAEEARKHLGTIEARYDQLWESRQRAIRDEILAAGATQEADLREAETRVRTLVARQKAIKKQADAVELRNAAQPTDEVDLALILEERASLRSMKEAVSRRLEQLNFENKGGTRIQVVNAALPPGSPVSNPRVKLMALAPMLMLPFTLMLFLGVEAIFGNPTPRSGVTFLEEPPASA